MQKRDVYKVFTTLISSVVNDEKVPKAVLESLTDQFLSALFNLANSHDLAHFISYALNKAGVTVPDEFVKKDNLAKYRYGISDYETSRIKSVFEEEQIPYIILKGEKLRKLYPEPYLRQSCDIDVLVKKEDLKRASEVIEKQFSSSKGEEQEHDIFFKTDTGVSIELHFSFGTRNGADDLLEKVWEKSVAVEGKYCFEMPDEIFNAYFIFHTANHFRIGGCGVKPIIDFYMLFKKRNFSANMSKEILEELGCLIFAEKAYALADAWFGDAKMDDVLLAMEEFVMDGGVYGSLKHRTEIYAVQDGKKFYRKRIFMSLKDLKIRYKKLEKYPFLYPFYTVVRWFSIFDKNRRKAIMYELEYKFTMTNDNTSKTAQLLKNLGL